MTDRRVEFEGAPVSFIGAWYLDNLGICDGLIDLYKSSPNKTPGIVFNRQGERLLDLESKDATELVFETNSREPLFHAYIAELQKVVVKYIAEYPWCNEFAAWRMVQAVNLQFYRPGAGYKRFHTERVSATSPNNNRHLVFMTYLNDVHDEGGTEFKHQKLIVSARKGLTLIWPVDWTFTHRGVVSPTEEKYIITGWFGFV
jgi:hypothetical protein